MTPPPTKNNNKHSAFTDTDAGAREGSEAGLACSDPRFSGVRPRVEDQVQQRLEVHIAHLKRRAVTPIGVVTNAVCAQMTVDPRRCTPPAPGWEGRAHLAATLFLRDPEPRGPRGGAPRTPLRPGICTTRTDASTFGTPPRAHEPWGNSPGAVSGAAAP